MSEQMLNKVIAILESANEVTVIHSTSYIDSYGIRFVNKNDIPDGIIVKLIESPSIDLTVEIKYNLEAIGHFKGDDAQRIKLLMLDQYANLNADPVEKALNEFNKLEL